MGFLSRNLYAATEFRCSFIIRLPKEENAFERIDVPGTTLKDYEMI